MSVERRSIDLTESMFRAVNEDGKRYLEGYAALYGKKSKLISENGRKFYETIERGAFDDVLTNKDTLVRLTYNHKQDVIIASTASGSLVVRSDEKGLFFRAEVPNVSYANDVYVLVERGDLFSNSFYASAFPKDIVWGNQDEEGIRTRTIRKFIDLKDVSIVPNAAYPDTELISRALKELDEIEKEENQPKMIDSGHYKRELELLKMKNNIL